MTQTGSHASASLTWSAHRADEHAGEQKMQRVKLVLLTVGLGVGGTEGQLVEIAVRLNRQRFDVVVCVLKGHDALTLELPGRGVRVIALNGKGKWDPRVLPGLYRTLRDERPEIVHSFLFLANVVARMVGRFLRIPVVISSYRGTEGWWGWPSSVADRLTVRWVHAVTCCSDAVRRATVSRLGDGDKQFHTIHNGVDIERFAKTQGLTAREVGLRDDCPVIGTVCRLVEPLKGVSVLLHALARLVAAPSRRRCQLLVVGEGPAYRTLEGLAQELGIAEFVIFTGLRRDVERLLPLMDVFVLASLKEGFGIALIEAMAASRPVVASAVGGILEIVVDGQTGRLVPPGDATALASAIGRLLGDPVLARTYGRSGQQRARDRFSIEAAVERHEQLYQKLVSGEAAWQGRA